jgi:hypothetical protein
VTGQVGEADVAEGAGEVERDLLPLGRITAAECVKSTIWTWSTGIRSARSDAASCDALIR